MQYISLWTISTNYILFVRQNEEGSSESDIDEVPLASAPSGRAGSESRNVRSAWRRDMGVDDTADKMRDPADNDPDSDEYAPVRAPVKLTWGRLLDDEKARFNRNTFGSRIKRSWRHFKTRVRSIRLPIIHPDSRFRRTWDFIILFLVIYNAVMVPFTAAFGPVDE